MFSKIKLLLANFQIVLKYNEINDIYLKLLNSDIMNDLYLFLSNVFIFLF